MLWSFCLGWANWVGGGRSRRSPTIDDTITRQRIFEEIRYFRRVLSAPRWRCGEGRWLCGVSCTELNVLWAAAARLGATNTLAMRISVIGVEIISTFMFEIFISDHFDTWMQDRTRDWGFAMSRLNKIAFLCRWQSWEGRIWYRSVIRRIAWHSSFACTFVNLTSPLTKRLLFSLIPRFADSQFNTA